MRRDDSAVVEDRYPIAEFTGLFEIVRAEQDRPAFCLEFANEGAQLAAGLRVEAGGGLVQHQHGRPVDHRECQKESLPLPSRKADEGFIGLAIEIETAEEFLAGKAMRIERAEEIQRLPRGDLVLQGGRLKLSAHVQLRPGCLLPRSNPSMWMEPASGWRNPRMHSRAVVLPAPFGPSSPRIWPVRTSKVTSQSASVLPYRFRKLVTEIAALILLEASVWQRHSFNMNVAQHSR